MIIQNFIGKGKQVNNVILLGEVVRYVEDSFGFSLSKPLHFLELKLYAVKFLGELYDPDSTGIDNISRTDGTVYCACDRSDLEGCLVEVRNKSKGVNLKWGTLNKEPYINAFNFFSNGDSWVVSDNIISPYVSSANNTFSALKDMFASDGGIQEMASTDAYKRAYLTLETVNGESVVRTGFDSDYLMGIAEEHLSEVYDKVYEEFFAPNVGNIISITELAGRLQRVLPAKFFQEGNLEELDFSVAKELESVGEVLGYYCGSGGNMHKRAVRAFKDSGLGEIACLQLFLMKPYLFSLMFGGFSLMSLDRIATLMSVCEMPVSFDGRGALVALSKYRSENDTLIRAEKLNSLGSSRKLNWSRWLPERPIEFVDGFNYRDLFQKVCVDGRFLGYTSWDNLYKEAFIISKLKEMSKRNHTFIKRDKIDKVVSSLPFELEPKQLEAVQHCEDGVVIIPGCAGSGKTTIARCISDIIGGSLGYAAPTGKAARRLSESVGMPVRTIHSLFHLGIGASGFLSPVLSDFSNLDLPSTLIIDEAAMINLDVMFQVVRKICDSRIKLIMMGDPNQLQPIGNGAIFRDLLKVFDPVMLEVSKRFAGGSGVGYNCKIIVEGGYNLEPRKDFVFKDADVSDIKTKCVSDFLAGVKALGIDAVQIATPYVKEDKPWGSTQLNELIQELLFSGKDELFLCNLRKFRCFEGTRVVQSGVNMAEKPHYSWDKSVGLFESHPDVIGVFNGDVGYVRGLVRSDSVRVDNSAVSAVYDIDYDERFEGYFLVVELGKNDFVLYPCKSWGDFFVGDEVSCLDLAYALTVHKLQGSEYEYVIFPISRSDSTAFVSNEMVYTALSRAKKYVTVVGSRDKVSQSLKVRKSPKIKTLMSMLK